MEKIELKFKEIENATFTWEDNQVVQVTPYISLANKIELMNDYINVYIAEENDAEKYWKAELTLILEIIDKFTNVNIEKNLADDIIRSGLWREIYSRIINYKSLREDISVLVEKVKYYDTYEYSFHKLTEKISNFIDKISKLDVSKEGLGELAKGLKSETDKLSEVFPTIKTDTEPKKRGRKKVS